MELDATSFNIMAKCNHNENEIQHTDEEKFCTQSFLESVYTQGNVEEVLRHFLLTSQEKLPGKHKLPNLIETSGIQNNSDNSTKVSFCQRKDKVSEEKSDRATWDPIMLWFRPSECCLEEISYQIKERCLSGISSIGCGTGLLEWLLNKLTGIEVVGYEINKEWWCSKYAPQQFIRHQYIDELSRYPIIPQNHAIFCCYFNNMEVFRRYLENYEGHLMVIIGSMDGSRLTNPGPLDFVESGTWQLTRLHETPHKDGIAFYEKKINL